MRLPTDYLPDHKRMIAAFGGDVADPAVKAEYLRTLISWQRGTGLRSLSQDNLQRIALVKLAEDADKPRTVPNGGSGPSAADIAKDQAANQTVEKKEPAAAK